MIMVSFDDFIDFLDTLPLCIKKIGYQIVTVYLATRLSSCLDEFNNKGGSKGGQC